jgi:hypothetical protein
MKTMQVKRVTGGHLEVLAATSQETVLGEPFEVPEDLGKALLADGTGRWQAATTGPVGRKLGGGA